MTGFDPDRGLIGPEVESSNKSCRTEQEVEALLRRYLESDVEDDEFEPRVVIQGKGEDLEIRRHGSKLYLYDRNDRNRQGIEVGPTLFSVATDSEDGMIPEEQEKPLQLSRNKSGSRIWIVIFISVLITAGIQALIFFNSQNNLYQEAEFSPLSPAKAGNLVQSWNGFFTGGFEDQQLGIHLLEDSRFVVYSSIDQGPWEILESGSFDVVSTGSLEGFQFESGVFVALLETGNLDYYGIPLNKMPVPGNLSPE